MRTSLNIDKQEWPEMWKAAYHLLEQTIVPSQLQAWIAPLEFVGTEAGENMLKIRLAAANDFSAQWVRDRHQKQMESAFGQVLGAACEVQILVKDAHKEAASYEPPTESVS